MPKINDELKDNNENNELDELRKMREEIELEKSLIEKQKEELKKEKEDNLKVQKELQNQKNNLILSKEEKEQDNSEAVRTAEKLKKNIIKIKIPVDPQNKDDKVVTVMINGYIWTMQRGESIEVPEEVAHQLEIGGYI